jgi:hypothetical protein
MMAKRLKIVENAIPPAKGRWPFDQLKKGAAFFEPDLDSWTALRSAAKQQTSRYGGQPNG